MQPLYNWHWVVPKKLGIKSQGLINPVDLAVPPVLDWNDMGSAGALTLKGARGETVYLDLILESRNVDGDVLIDITDVSKNGGLGLKDASLKLVTTWFQAGIMTRKSKYKAYLTHELLLDDDRNIEFSDAWVKDQGGVDWVYQPPEIPRLQGVKTALEKGKKKRLLMMVNIPRDMDAGTFILKIMITDGGRGHAEIASIPVRLDVLPFILKPIKSEDYKLFIFTGMALDDMPGRPGSYLNTNRIHGDYAQRKKIFESYIDDIAAHGFNGLTLKDWRSPYIDDALRITKQKGIQNVIVHAASPVDSKHGQSIIRETRFPIVNKPLVDLISSMGYQPIFYGYDEVGGNKRLNDQLALNRKIHDMGGKVINAIFWNDRKGVISAVGEDNSSMFDMMATSMGSHGQKAFFAHLPINSRKSLDGRRTVEEFAYWHPNEENPVMNRVFMGFWLWSSGLSGVIPHGHYFPSHIGKAMETKDLVEEHTRNVSPYNDWSYWLPPGNLRHHATVYPAQNGPIPTLQWEGIRDGVTDLRYAVMLEQLAKSSSTVPRIRQLAKSLIGDIKKKMLDINDSYINDRRSMRLIETLGRWRSEIQQLLTLKYNTEKKPEAQF